METIEIEEVRGELHEMIDLVRDEKVLNAVYVLLKREVDFWFAISASERQAIEQGLAQLDRGEFIPHENVKNSYQKWL